MKLVTAAEMKQIEEKAMDIGISDSELMTNAGFSVAEAILQQPQFSSDGTDLLGEGGLVIILAGPGNNGGDAMVVAAQLSEIFPDTPVKIYHHNRPRPGKNFPDKLTYTPSENQEALALEKKSVWQEFLGDLEGAVLLVDGLLGSGLSREVTGKLTEIIEQVNAAREERQYYGDPMFVVAIDIPSGLNADTGEVMGVAIKADLTVTLGMPKQGLYNYAALDYTGQVRLGDIGLPAQLLAETDEQKKAEPSFISAKEVRHWLPPRPANGHKGTFGKLMVISGSDEYLGAAYLCTVGAMRSGAGLVTLATSHSAIEIMAAKSSENTYFELKLPNREEESVLPVFEQKLESYNALLIGPGLGEFSWKPAYIFNLDNAKKLKTVVDADALNYLARTPEWWKNFSPDNILTPHPAELARLRGTDVASIEADRVKATREAAAEFGQVVILKGAYTVIAAPDGRVGLNPAANPALATAGSGDVLAGICAGLLAQASKLPEMDIFKIACCGVYLHALAGELCRREMGDIGVLAGDLLSKIPLAFRNLKQGDSLE